VDDHKQVLATMSAMLSADFDVVGTASDGRQGLDLAHGVQPDAIVLDVDMPGLDGFQTIRALRESDLRATPVVFLSMHAADEIIGEAFRCGGRGYVLKSRASRDLASALDQALRGRMFAPSLTSLFRVANGNMHAMQLHRDTASLLEGLTAVFDLALRRGDATCVIASNDVREGLAKGLRARGWNVGDSTGHERYLVIDADDALKRFMRNGLPSPDRVAEMAAELDQYRLAAGEGPTPRLTVFGNMVVSLGMQDNAEAAISLERLWNTMTAELPFFTLCGYATKCFHAGSPDLLTHACNEHAALSHAIDA
jgi:DNA-binding NarL/FixJ family response regulator